MKTRRSVKQRVKLTVQLTGYAFFAVLALMPLSSGAAAGIKVFDPGIEHFGKSYNELAGDWWSWAVRFPFATNPLVEDGAVDCTRGQQGKIWFLAGNFGGTSHRACTIPTGKALFFPIRNTLWWVPEDGATVAEVRALAHGDIHSTTSLEVIIDGVVIDDPFAYRAQSPPGGFALPCGPLLADFGFSPTPDPRDPAVADGYWILLAPLHKGAHVIEFRSSSPQLNVEVTYHLTVGQDDD